MASIPGARLDIIGASGSQGLLGPKSSWRCYVLPRGGYASQDSTGTLITFDSASVASRFAASDWIQAGLSVANIRQVSAVGGNSLSVSGAALTVAENTRIFLIGTTEPTVVGGSATYTPASTIRQRDDDAADTYANSMVTSNADGLIQFFGGPAIFDCLIQDGNQTLQGALIDLPVGAVEGISTSSASTFGTTVTFNGPTIFNDTMDSAAPFYLHRTNGTLAAFGVTGVATFNSRVQFGASFAVNGAIGVTGHAKFGNSVTIDGALGVTGQGVFGATISIVGTSGNYSHVGTASFGSTFTVSAGASFGSTITFAREIYGTDSSGNARLTIDASSGGAPLIGASGQLLNIQTTLAQGSKTAGAIQLRNTTSLSDGDFALAVVVGGGIKFAVGNTDHRIYINGVSGEVAAGQIIAGLVAPEGAVQAPPGSIYLRASGGAGTTLYVKETGTTTSGWVGK